MQTDRWEQKQINDFLRVRTRRGKRRGLQSIQRKHLGVMDIFIILTVVVLPYMKGPNCTI